MWGVDKCPRPLFIYKKHFKPNNPKPLKGLMSKLK